MTEALNISVPETQPTTIRLRVVGTSPLIQHQWSAKGKREILDKQMKKANKKKEARDPFEEFEGTLYRFKPGRFIYPKGAKKNLEFPIEVKFTGEIGIPAIWFKKAIVGAVRNVDGLHMVLVKGVVFVKGEQVDSCDQRLIKVNYKKLLCKEDVVRIGMGTADLRYRAELIDWTADIELIIDTDVLSIEQVINLLKKAGFACGLGEWRPQRDGDFGTFEVEGISKNK